MDYFIEYGYAGLFLIAFLAATILPLSSEIVLSALTIKGLSPITLVVIATAGNVLGSLLNYALGYSASSAVIKKWLRMSDNSLAQAEQRFTKYGLLTLCFAWVPIIGDPITVLSGILRVPVRWFIILVTFGKCLRYVVVVYIALKVT